MEMTEVFEWSKMDRLLSAQFERTAHDECSSLLTQGKGKNMAEKSSFRHPEIVCINLNRNCADVCPFPLPLPFSFLFYFLNKSPLLAVIPS